MSYTEEEDLRMKKILTTQKEVHLSGIGIHSGKMVQIRLNPSSAGQVVFRRTDLKNLELRLDWRWIEANHHTAFISEECRIRTLEHLLAVLYAFGIDSLVVDMDGEEVPILDGSALPLVNLVSQAGARALQKEKKSIRIVKPFTVGDAEASVSWAPDTHFKITYCIEFDHPAIQKQELSLEINVNNFKKEIAPARTFGFLKDVEALRKQGLALGGSLENALVLDEQRVINGPLRFPDEFVRHKILDFVGDLSLIAHPLIGHFRAHRAGHDLHLQAVRFLLKNPEYWTYD